MKIILVSIGNFQNYIIHNIKNLLLFNNTDITVITEKQFFPLLESFNIELIDTQSCNDLNFNSHSKLDKHFRNGFWHYCSLRFFYIYSYLINHNVSNCIHLENDVMTYINFNEINFDNQLYATFDHPTRVIPGIIYIPNPESFKHIIDNYNCNINDMENLALSPHLQSLPIYPIIDNIINKYNQNFTKFNCIFDAAAIGQYLGGIDPRNQSGDTRGFINETCVIKYNNHIFYWIKINDLYCPHLYINNKMIRIINLHIHSKNLQNFMADNPNETKFIKILD
jgi:hypothetical protein